MSETTLIRAVMHRRLPQILGLYLAGAWIAVEFSNLIVERYGLSQTLVDFLLVLLASFVPTVLMLAWFHGAPGRDQWTSVEKIGIPINVLLSVALLAALFQGKELGAATRTVTVTNEEGQKVERVLAKPGLRKRIALFFLDNQSGDAELDWLQYGLTVGLATNLDRSLFVDVWTPYREYEARGFTEFSRAGFADGLDVPTALMQSIAERKRRDFFISGAFDNQEGVFTLQLDAYRTDDARLVFSEQASGPDVLILADRLSARMQAAIDLPESDGRERLGLADRADSWAALRFAVLGLNAEHLDNDLPQAVEYWRQAVAEDPSFAPVHMMLADAIFQLGDMDAAAAAVRNALQHDYKLTDDDKFVAKGMNYMLRSQPEKALRLHEMWVELYPENTLARKYLAAAYTQIANRPDDALIQLQTVYDLDPNDDRVLLWMAELHEVTGELDRAISNYSLYSVRNPEDQTAMVSMAATLADAGQLEAARENYQRAELLAPELVAPVVGLADIALREGRFDAARRQLSDAEMIARIPQQEARVVRGWIDYYQARGQLKNTLDLVDRLYQVEQAYLQPINLMMMTHVHYADAYAMADETQRGLAILSRLQAEFEPPLDGLADVGFLKLWLASGDRQRGAEYTEKVDAFLQLMQQERYYYGVEMARARLAELDGDLQQAIAYGRSALERFGQSVLSREDSNDRTTIHLSLAHNLTQTGEFDEAQQILDDFLVSDPAHPVANLRLAQLAYARGDLQGARQALQKTIAAYVDADEVYPPAVAARRLALELEAAG